MSARALAKRNLTEARRDPLSLGLNVALPVGMLLVLQLLADVDEFFSIESVAPGAVFFGFVMVMFSAALTLSRDRENAFFARLRTAPLSPAEFVSGYAAPYLPVALIQALVLFGVSWLLGLRSAGSLWAVGLIVLAMAVLYVGWGMILGATFSTKSVTFPYMAILLLTIFGGAWMNLEAIGGALRTVAEWFPFAHALDATRAILIDGATLGDVASDVAWVLAYVVATVPLAVYVFRRRVVA